MKRLNSMRILSLAVALLLAGCPGVPGPLNQGGNGPVDSGSLVSNNTAGFVGNVRVPSELISNNSGGLVSNNSGSLVSNNSGSYRVAALDEIALANSLVYLLSPNEHFYADASGKRYVATTDASGSYKFDKVLPENTQVIVSALLAGNRRMVGYTLSAKGDNQVNVSVATTYVVEFFRAQAKAAGKNLSDYPDAMAELPALVTETQTLLDSGKLPLPDLTIGNAGAMNKVYFAVFASQSQSLSDKWAKLLGKRMIPLTTVAGNYTLGSEQKSDVAATSFGLNTPTGVAVDTKGNVYVAAQQQHVVYKIAPDGKTTVLGKFRGDGSITVPELVPGPNVDSVTIDELSIPMPQDLATIGDNLVIVPFSANPATEHNNVLLFICQTSGPYFGRSLEAGRVYRLGVDNPDMGGDPVTRYHDGNVFNEATFRSPQGICTDDAGNLYVADRRNNLIRRIDRTSGQVTTVAGKVVEDENGRYGDQLTSTQASTDSYTVGWDGLANGDGGDALGAILNRPYDVAWRRNGTSEELFVWEGFNPDLAFADGVAADILDTGNAIRRIKLETGKIDTLVGGKKEHGLTDGQAASAQIKLVDPAFPDVPNGGLAVSPDGKYLYFCDSHNQRVRMVDLTTETVQTVAGGGSVEGNTEAGLSAVSDVSGLAVDAQGNVYFCDAISHVVRRLTYQYGR